MEQKKSQNHKNFHRILKKIGVKIVVVQKLVFFCIQNVSPAILSGERSKCSFVIHNGVPGERRSTHFEMVTLYGFFFLFVVKSNRRNK